MEELGFDSLSRSSDRLDAGYKRTKAVLDKLLAQGTFSAVREDNLMRYLAGWPYEDSLTRFSKGGCERVGLFGSRKVKYDFNEYFEDKPVDPRSVLKKGSLAAYEDHKVGFNPSKELFAFTLQTGGKKEAKIAVFDVRNSLPYELTIYGNALNVGNIKYKARFFYQD